MSDKQQIIGFCLVFAAVLLIPSVRTLWRFRDSAFIPVLAVLFAACGFVMALVAFIIGVFA